MSESSSQLPSLQSNRTIKRCAKCYLVGIYTVVLRLYVSLM